MARSSTCRDSVDRSVEEVVGVRADEHLCDDARTWSQTFGGRALFGHPQHCGGAVGDLGAVAGRVHAVGKDRLEVGETFEGRVAQTTVTRDEHSFAGGTFGAYDGRFHGNDLPVKARLLPCERGASL